MGTHTKQYSQRNTNYSEVMLYSQRSTIQLIITKNTSKAILSIWIRQYYLGKVCSACGVIICVLLGSIFIHHMVTFMGLYIVILLSNLFLVLLVQY